jgi:pimeloyl-ACP methyl ester carboxylesterase
MPATYTDSYYTSHDQLQLHVRDYGHPSPQHTVLCIPGLTRNARDFTGLCEHLRHQHRVLAVDLRGRGLSDYDPDPQQYHPGTYVQDILTLLAHLQLSKVVLVGTSLGGLISMVLTPLQPALISGVILNDIGPEIVAEGISRIKDYVGKDVTAADWDEAVRKTRALNASHFPDFTDARWLEFTQGLYRPDEQRGRGLRLDYDPAIRVLYETLEPDKLPALWPQFETMATTPILLVRGALSNIISAACVGQMRAIKPDLQVCELANRGHAPTLTEPESSAAIDRFLAQLPR